MPMILLLIIVTSLGYLAAYFLYGKFLANKLFKLSSKAAMPSKTLQDNKDYIPTPKWVVMGHHFTSIAGTGPIVGPAIGIIWGWVPALIWVFLGSIFMGAVHDFFALVLSVRNEGKSVSDVAGKCIHPAARLLFLALIFFLLLIVIAIFGLVIAIIFDTFPTAVLPVFLEIAISILFFYLQKKFPKAFILNTILCFGLLMMTLIFGYYFPITLPNFPFLPATGLWTLILLAYAFVASILPVQILLQPRDYLNAWKLYTVLGLIIAALIVLGTNPDFVFVAPAFAESKPDVPSMWPFLCITIACGAISGFHSLVSSGTSAKQLKRETDATFVGYGSMLIEGFLAILVLIAVGAGIGLGYMQDTVLLTGYPAWISHYGSWAASAGLTSKLKAVVIGFANMLESIGIAKELGVMIMGVFIASFAGTTLDTATRLQRYIIGEFSHKVLKKNISPLLATGIAVFSAAGLAFGCGPSGKGALSLWPLFGVTNQLIAVLALILFCVYVYQKNKKFLPVVAIPLLILATVILWAMGLQIIQFFTAAQWVLVSILILLFLILIMFSYYSLKKLRNT